MSKLTTSERLFGVGYRDKHFHFDDTETILKLKPKPINPKQEPRQKMKYRIIVYRTYNWKFPYVDSNKPFLYKVFWFTKFSGKIYTEIVGTGIVYSKNRETALLRVNKRMNDHRRLWCTKPYGNFYCEHYA